MNLHIWHKICIDFNLARKKTFFFKWTKSYLNKIPFASLYTKYALDVDMAVDYHQLARAATTFSTSNRLSAAHKGRPNTCNWAVWMTKDIKIRIRTTIWNLNNLDCSSTPPNIYMLAPSQAIPNAAQPAGMSPVIAGTNHWFVPK